MDNHNGIEFDVSATVQGVDGIWVGEYVIHGEIQIGGQVPGEFTSENDAREEARRYVKGLIDSGAIEGPGSD